MCFVFIWEQTATCATYSINWSVFIIEMRSVYCAVRTGSLNKAVCSSSLKGYRSPCNAPRRPRGGGIAPPFLLHRRFEGGGWSTRTVVALPPGTFPVTSFTDDWVAENKIFGCSDLMNFGLCFSRRHLWRRLLERDSALSGRNVPTFRRNLLPLFPG